MPRMRGASASTRPMKQQVLLLPTSSPATRVPRGRAVAGRARDPAPFAAPLPLPPAEFIGSPAPRSCALPGRVGLLRRRGFLWRRGVDAQHETVGEPHIDDLDVTL